MADSSAVTASLHPGQPPGLPGSTESGFTQATPASIEVVKAGTCSLLVDYPGRTGYWAVGVPPSGPMDALAFRLANATVGNHQEAVGLELTLSGPSLRFSEKTVVALVGAHMPAEVDGVPCPYERPFEVPAGGVLTLGAVEGCGVRTYLAVQGGFAAERYLGSGTTFTLGKFGGLEGRALRGGDRLSLLQPPTAGTTGSATSLTYPQLTSEWELRVMEGPHAAPDFLTNRDMASLYGVEWLVHHHSARTGVRLIGPKPEWARTDGGEAGLHPSNIHDVPYAIGAIDFTGDMPVLLGPDGPSLGGFVCPATVVTADLWKLGQLRPGDKVRFVRISLEQARKLEAEQEHQLTPLAKKSEPGSARPLAVELSGAVLAQRRKTDRSPSVVYRQAGDKNLLVEYGPPQLDLALRFRAQTLLEWLERSKLPGILDLTCGIRSLQIHYDGATLEQRRLLEALMHAEDELSELQVSSVPSRIVHLPLSWDDPATRLAIERYTQLVRPDAPWAPSNIEFIRRINGLTSEAKVKEIVYSASYLVLGLGDVYLGAPVATPVDPRHRLVTTKYNPARTWTPENAVGIGGAYLCVYGMEGPGGYQFVGRTLQMWDRLGNNQNFEPQKPWLLRAFDQIRFFEVNPKELLEIREAFPYGRYSVKIEPTRFDLLEYSAFLQANQAGIERFKRSQEVAFNAERERWRVAERSAKSHQALAALTT